MHALQLIMDYKSITIQSVIKQWMLLYVKVNATHAHFLVKVLINTF